MEKVGCFVKKLWYYIRVRLGGFGEAVLVFDDVVRDSYIPVSIVYEKIYGITWEEKKKKLSEWVLNKAREKTVAEDAIIGFLGEENVRKVIAAVIDSVTESSYRLEGYDVTEYRMFERDGAPNRIYRISSLDERYPYDTVLSETVMVREIPGVKVTVSSGKDGIECLVSGQDREDAVRNGLRRLPEIWEGCRKKFAEL